MAVAASGAFALFAGPASYAVANVGHALNGNNVLAGPSGVGGGGFGGPGGGGRGFGGGTPPTGGGSAQAGAAGRGTRAPVVARRRLGPSAAARLRPARPAVGRAAAVASAAAPRSPPSMLGYLEANQGCAKYLVAATGSQTTAPIIIETGKAVVTIGGFSGSDNSPTVAQLAQMVADGELKYVVGSGQRHARRVGPGARHRGRRLRGSLDLGHRARYRRARLREPLEVTV